MVRGGAVSAEGKLTLHRLSNLSLGPNQKSKGESQKAKITDPRPLPPDPQASEAEAYFLKAIDIARKQQAKSLELRAVMSLVRLRRQQVQETSRTTHHEARAKLDEAHNMLSEVYTWFTEGFDTKDLQEAKRCWKSYHKRS